jgi:hypothetical protein
MTVDRFLGAAFASVHGPTDPKEMLIWSLDQGFRGLLPAPSPRAVDWSALRRARGQLPFRFGGVRVSTVHNVESLAEAGLASRNQGDRNAAVAAVSQAVSLARRLGCARVLLEPGVVQVPGEVSAVDLGDSSVGWTTDAAKALLIRRNTGIDVALDSVCRSLHQLHRDHPDMVFCLTPSRNALGLGDFRAMSAIFEDLSRCRIAYWHDATAVACRQILLGEDPGQFLEEFSNIMTGMTLGDFCEGQKYLPPGAGGVDYPLLSAYRHQTAKGFAVAVELDPGVDPAELRGVKAFLDKFGL